MKRFLISLFSILNGILLFSQQLAMDEAAEDAQLADSLTIGTIITGLVFVVLFFILYKYSKELKNYNKKRYYKHLKASFIISLVIGVAVFSAIDIYYSNKRDSLEREAKGRLKDICNRVDIYVDVYDNIPLEIDRISSDDFYTKGNYIYGNQFYFLDKPHDEDVVTVYSCYSISRGPKLEVSYAKAAKKLSLREYETPGLYNIWISPYRIRYFSEYSNPERDVTTTFPYFVDRFLRNYHFQVVDDILESTTNDLKNDYFKIEEIDMDVSPNELWKNHRKMYDNDGIDQMNTYEYETLNFGDFEIMYCITLSSKLGIVEKMAPSGMKNKRENFDFISSVEKNRSFNKFLRIYILFLVLLIVTFILGRPRN